MQNKAASEWSVICSGAVVVLAVWMFGCLDAWQFGCLGGEWVEGLKCAVF